MLDDVIIRPAEPSDVERAVPLIYSSGPKAFEWVFACEGFCNAQDFLKAAFLAGNNAFGFRNHTVAVFNNEVVGSIAHFTNEQAKKFSRSTILEILKFYGFMRSLAILRRGLRIERAIPPPVKGRLYVAHVGVHPDFQGQGVGTAMMHAACDGNEEAKQLIPSLDVATTNPQAQALYERLGFQVVTERPGPDPSVPDHRYMEWVR